MARHIPFVGREEELGRIDACMQEWGTRRVVCIDGPGGIGKTWLMREVRQRYEATKSQPLSLLVTDILDLSDEALNIPQNIGYRIAHMLDAKIFDPYLFVLHNWHKMGQGDVNAEQLRQSALALNQTFINCFNMVSSQHRVVLCIDTVDSLDREDVLQYIVEVGKRLDNVVVLIAGRNAVQIERQMRPTQPSNVQTIHLEPLAAQASVTYLRHKQEQLATHFASALAHNLLHLAAGRPILLNLAAEWATYAEVPAWLQAEDLPDPPTPPDGTITPWQQQFEQLVVQHIATPRTRLGRLVLLLARITPLDVPAIAALLDVPTDEAQQLYRELATVAFVRELPNQRLVLHDEIARLINEATWPALDPQGEQRRADSQQAVAYLQQLIDATQEHLERVSRDGPTDPRTEHARERPLMERQIVARMLWLRKGQYLVHMLWSDVDAGFATFLAMFAEATENYLLRFRGILLEHVLTYVGSLSPDQEVALQICRLEHLFDRGEYVQARQLALMLLGQEPNDPAQRVDLLLRLSNAEIRLGYLDQSVAHLDRAMRMCKLHGLDTLLLAALNARGWAYRNQGKHNQALIDYLEAYQRSLQMNEHRQMAWALTNISFISALRGDRQAAYEGCRTALHLWEASGFMRGRGAAYSTLGAIHMRFNEPSEAMSAYGQALDIFTREDDRDWISLVRCGRAYVFQSLGNFSRAAEDLDWALQYGPMNLRTRILYSWAMIYWDQKDLHRAHQKFEECRSLSQEMGDSFHDYKSFADLIELAWEAGDYDRWPNFLHALNTLYAEMKTADAIRLRGSSLRKTGDLAICNGDYEDALACYKEGFPILAEYETHERYTIRAQMRQTNQRIRSRVPRALLGRLGSDLAAYWRNNMVLVVKYPEALLTFHQWEQEGQNNEQPKSSKIEAGTDADGDTNPDA